MSYTLLIDTAFDRCQVGLAQGDKLVAQHIDKHSGGAHDRVLAGIVHDMLQHTHCTVRDLDKIAVTTGPGSFNGLRVGIAFARGLALVHHTPLVGLSTAQLFLRDIHETVGSDTHVAVLLNVKRGESYGLLAAPHVGEIERIMDADLEEWLRARASLVVAGFMTDATRDKISAVQGIELLADMIAPSLAQMAVLAAVTEPLPSEAVRPYYGA